jgi:hypothetical protein
MKKTRAPQEPIIVCKETLKRMAEDARRRMSLKADEVLQRQQEFYDEAHERQVNKRYLVEEE